MVQAGMIVFIVFNAIAVYFAVLALRNTNLDVPASLLKALLSGPAASEYLYTEKGRRHKRIALILHGIGFLLGAIFLALG